jgi:AcrR family transcriptional regulator
VPATPGPGLREQKKARTRAAIAVAAAELFGRDGYPNVTMAQVAAAVGIADQTLYNYFPTKESLVFDKAGELEEYLIQALTSRPPGVGVIDAYAGWLAMFVQGEAARRALASPGGMVRLVAASDALHRGLAESEGFTEPAAVTAADALLAVFVRTIERLGAAPGEAELPGIAAWAQASLDTLRPLFAGQADLRRA